MSQKSSETSSSTSSDSESDSKSTISTTSSDSKVHQEVHPQIPVAREAPLPQKQNSFELSSQQTSSKPNDQNNRKEVKLNSRKNKWAR